MGNKQISKKHIIRIRILIGIAIFLCFIIANNTNLFSRRQSEYKFLAHRGLAQTYDESKTDHQSNTATMIDTPEYPYLENTIESIQVAFNHGAQIVELDIKLTKDKQFAVFHDSTLEHRTDGTGEVGDYTMEELKKLDIGYGYTSDNGKTYPFRGKGIGLMPELKEVLNTFPDKELLIHIKDGNMKTVELLSEFISELPSKYTDLLYFYGDDNPIEYIEAHNPGYKVFSKKMMIASILKYTLIGWTGIIPESLENKILLLPADYAPFIWGFPQKFIDRMESVNTIVVLVKGDGSPAEGYDNIVEMQEIPKGFNGYIWTNRIDLVTDVKDNSEIK